MVEPWSWAGCALDDFGGAAVGRVQGLYLDAEGGEPAWLVVRLGRRRAKLVAVPLGNCAAAAGRVWVAHERNVLSSAPAVDPARPLLREHELTICAHYGISERLGRAAAVVGRPEGTVTAQPG